MRLARALPVVLALFCASTYGGAARADDDASARAYRQGEEAYRAKRYREAAESFERAYAGDPRGSSIYNAGLAWLAAGDAPRAADAFAAAQGARDLPDAFAADAKSKLADLERALARVDVTAPAGSRITLAHATDAATPAHVHVAPGRHTIRVAFANGGVRTKTITVHAGATLAVDFDVPATAPARDPDPAPPPDPPRDRDAPSPAPASSGDRTLAWVALGGGALAFGVAGYLHLQTLSAAQDFRNDRSNQDLHDKATSLQTGTWIALGVGAAATATGVVLLLTKPSDGATAASRTELSVGAGSILVRGTF